MERTFRVAANVWVARARLARGFGVSPKQAFLRLRPGRKVRNGGTPSPARERRVRYPSQKRALFHVVGLC